MKILRRIKNLIELSKIEVTSEKREQIKNVINEPPKKMAEIIKLKSVEDTIKDLLNEK